MIVSNSKFKAKLKWTLSSLIAPAIFIGAFLLIFIIFLFKIQHNSVSLQAKDIRSLSERISKNIDLKLKGNLDFIKLLAIDRAHGHLTETEFQSQVLQYLKDHPEFINITWIDSEFKIKTVCPLEGNSHIIGLPIELPEPKRASRLAKESKESIYTKPFEAIQSNQSFEVWVPVHYDDKFLGLFAGVYSCERILKQSVPPEKYFQTYFSLLDENDAVISEFAGSEFINKEISHQTPLIYLNNGMKVSVEMMKTQPFSWIIIVLVSLSILLLLSFGYSLWKIRLEILIRKEYQESLQKNEIVLKQQNEKYVILNDELQESNNRILKINDELIIAKERAEESDRLKTAFLQNMSHEIRTPLNAIMGFSNLLTDNNSDKSKIEKYSSIINQRSKDLLDIIKDILDIAKIESGQVSVYIEQCTLKDLFSELTDFFTEYQNRYNKENIKFKLRANGIDHETVLLTDKLKLKQIFINLISNAFKFTDEGIIEGGCIVDDQKNIVFYISDTGIGIPADKHEKIFERFTQIESGKRSIAGTGLGLSIVKGLVHLMGGEIWLKSEPGKGSTFTFSFPIEIKQNLHFTNKKTRQG